VISDKKVTKRRRTGKGRETRVFLFYEAPGRACQQRDGGIVEKKGTKGKLTALWHGRGPRIRSRRADPIRGENEETQVGSGRGFNQWKPGWAGPAQRGERWGTFLDGLSMIKSQSSPSVLPEESQDRRNQEPQKKKENPRPFNPGVAQKTGAQDYVSKFCEKDPEDSLRKINGGTGAREKSGALTSSQLPKRISSALVGRSGPGATPGGGAGGGGRFKGSGLVIVSSGGFRAWERGARL